MFHTLPAVQDVIIHTSDYNGTLYMGWLIHHIITITIHSFSNSLVFVNTPNIDNFYILHFFNLIPTVENDVALLSKFKMCFHLAFMICFWPITNIFCKKNRENWIDAVISIFWHFILFFQSFQNIEPEL